MEIMLPYGRSQITGEIPDQFLVEHIEPPQFSASESPTRMVDDALGSLRGEVAWGDFFKSKSVAVAINDKTRPVPLNHLLPPLMDRLHSLAIEPQAVRFFISVGAHPPMTPDEMASLLPEGLVNRYDVVSHNCEDKEQLIFLGNTSHGTPIWANREYYESDFKIVVGNIEPHQFVGFSGGVKGAAIGLSGLATINHNHALMTQPGAQLGQYDQNPVRQDIEEIGQKFGVHLVVNAILNPDRNIIAVLAGEAVAVMKAGIPMASQILQVPVAEAYDLLISSPGGHPKDINVYQSQKALAHAARITKPGGTIILVAACPDGSGSPHYQEWVSKRKSNLDVMRQFIDDGFHIGPHKAYLIARDAARYRLLSCTELDKDLASKLLLNPVENLQSAINLAIQDLNPGDRIGILAHATSTIPYLENQIH